MVTLIHSHNKGSHVMVTLIHLHNKESHVMVYNGYELLPTHDNESSFGSGNGHVDLMWV